MGSPCKREKQNAADRLKPLFDYRPRKPGRIIRSR
jgi:hypothetical protein